MVTGKVPRWKNGPRWLRVYGSARKETERLGQQFLVGRWVGLVRFVWGHMKRSGRFVETTVQVKWNSKIKIHIFLSLTSFPDCWNVVVGPLTQFRQFQSWKTIRESSRIQVNMKSRPAWFQFSWTFFIFLNQRPWSQDLQPICPKKSPQDLLFLAVSTRLIWSENYPSPTFQP